MRQIRRTQEWPYLENAMSTYLASCFRGWLIAAIPGIMLVAGSAVRDCDAAEENASILRSVADYPLPGKATRWDYMSLDRARSRLYIAHLGDSTVVVVDTKTKAVVGTVPNVGQVHGVLAIPELDRVYATATGTNEVVAIDATNLKISARIPGGVYPDGLAYAPEVHKLYISDERGKTETVIDALSNKRIATIPLGGRVGNTQYDSASRHVFVNVQGRSELIEIDPATDKIVQRIPVPDADGNHGLLIEPVLHLAFIACEGNDKLLVMNLHTNKIESEFSLGSEPDVLAYDLGAGRLYVASESGPVSEFMVSNHNVAKAGEQVVGRNAHTVAVEPSTHEVFFPLKSVGGRPVLRIMSPITGRDRSVH